MENGRIKPFNGKMRDGLLNIGICDAPKEVEVRCEGWHQGYDAEGRAARRIPAAANVRRSVDDERSAGGKNSKTSALFVRIDCLDFIIAPV